MIATISHDYDYYDYDYDYYYVVLYFSIITQVIIEILALSHGKNGHFSNELNSLFF